MGDADNKLPPSKKRAAGRELSRDNPGLDDEDDVSEQETGMFKKASEEVLASRRIVKVRRNQTSSTPSAPSSNPFASICLLPHKDPTATQETAKTACEESQDNVNKETKKEEDGDNGDNQQPESKIDKETVKTACEEAQDHVKRETEKEEAGDNQKPESNIDQETSKTCEESQHNVKTGTGKEEDGGNQQPESKIDQETVKTAREEAQGNVKTETEKQEDGFNQEPKSKIDEEKHKDVKNENLEGKNTETSSVNSFQQLSSSQNAFTGLVGTGFSSSTFSFTSVTNPSFSFGNNGNKTPSLQQTLVETGEEDEKAVFTSHSVLFEFLDGAWKERGKGELKVNVSTTGAAKARLVMRSRGNYRLILNASLFPDIKLTNMEKKGVTFACLNSTGEEEKDSFLTFALKFKDASVVEEFRAIVMRYKGGGDTGATVSKTPKNSDE